MEYVLIGLFLLLTALGVPVAFSLCLSAATLLFFYMDRPLVMVSQMMFSGIDSFSFMAVPFFMLAGAFMSAGGVTSRLVSFSQALVGALTGGLAQTVSVAACSSPPSRAPRRNHGRPGQHHDRRAGEKGYDRDWATGIVASSGTVGIVIPPSITMWSTAPSPTPPSGISSSADSSPHHDGPVHDGRELVLRPEAGPRGRGTFSYRGRPHVVQGLLLRPSRRRSSSSAASTAASSPRRRRRPSPRSTGSSSACSFTRN